IEDILYQLSGERLARLDQRLAMARRLHVLREPHALMGIGTELHPGVALLEPQHVLALVEVSEDLLVGEDLRAVGRALLQEPERAQEGGGVHLPPPIDAHVQQVVGVEVELDPRAAVGDHARRVERLAGGERLAFVVVEEDAGGALELADDDPFGAVDDERPLVGHERELAQVHLLAALLPDRARLRLLVMVEDDKAERDLQRDREGHAAVMAFLDCVLRIAEVERVELQQRVVVVVGDREHRLEDSLEPDVLPAVRGGILLQKRLVRALLHLNEVRNLNDRRDLAEVLTAAAPALDHSCHMFSRRTVTSSSTRPAPRLAPQGGSPPYLIWTLAPCSSSFFFVSSASALVTFSFTAFGAPSTRSFASLSPSAVSSRTTLMTWIFFSPAAVRTTSNSVFSSVAAPPPAG